MISKDTFEKAKELFKTFTNVPIEDMSIPYALLLNFTESLMTELEILQKEFVEVEKRLDKTILLLDCEPTAH